MAASATGTAAKTRASPRSTCAVGLAIGDTLKCHPASATLELEGGHLVRIDEVRVGDKIRAPTGFEPVTGFLHAERRQAEYLRFTTEGGVSVEISVLHHLFANGTETDPADVAVGDLLQTARGREVNRIAHVTAHPRL
mmetsp:Transcript_44533/g.147612  ORF Transcript_44533/g.147612 Transcript_44533/m.147612 type:complete len:138 (+) Transcript_44533:384-797(+)